MRIIKLILIPLAIFSCLEISSAEEFTFDNFPSVSEIYEAYLRGDIEYETYLTLSEIIEDGIDESEFYLFEEIPNLNYFEGVNSDSLVGDNLSKAQPFMGPDQTKDSKPILGFARLRGYQEIDETAASRRDLRIKTVLTDEWSTELRIEEDFVGRSEIARRSFIYATDRGQVHRMVLGNYSARFGLGLTVGYRGKILNKSESSTATSIAFPDYGGFNGVYIEGGRENDGMRFMAHYDRDDSLAFKTAAINLIRNMKYFDVEIIGLGSFIENRILGTEYKYYQLGGYARYTKYNFTAALELAHAKDASNFIPAAIFETAYKLGSYRLEFSGWRYSDDYKNIAGGGRAGSYYQTVLIDTLDFDYRDKRINQRGLLFKSKAKYLENADLNVSFTYYGPDRYENNLRMLISSVNRLFENHEFKLGYRYDRRDRVNGLATESEYRFEHKATIDNFSLRSYIGYHDDDNDKEYISLFNRTRADFGRYGTVETWLNLDKLNTETKQNDYFYCYIKESFRLNSTIDIAIKYSYRYSRNYFEKERSLLLLEAVGRW